jgi:hypothetical protein
MNVYDKIFAIILPLITLLIVYLIFSFIAWDFNLTHWLLFTTITGRCVFAFFFISYMAASIEFYIKEL